MKQKGKQFFALFMVLFLFVFATVPTVVHACTGGDSTVTSDIAGLPNPSFDGTNPCTGFTNQKATSQQIADKGRLAITTLVSFVGIILVGVGVVKGFRLASSSARTRADVIQDIVWWLAGGAVVFLAGVITSAVFYFSTQ